MTVEAAPPETAPSPAKDAGAGHPHADSTAATLLTPTPDASPRHVIVTVHGTNSQHPDDNGERWWQTGSPFAGQLATALAKRGISTAEILPLHWSGQNSDFDRLRAAAELAKTLRKLEKSGTSYSIIAHSHGGNVTAEALALLPPSELRGGVVTFGTPFFTRKLKSVPWLIALFQAAMGIIIAPIMLWYLVTILGAGTTKWIETIVFFGGLLLLSIWSAQRGLRTLLWRRRARYRCARGIKPGQWLVIHSPRDEAMRLLETAAAISPQYVTVAAARRSLTAFARLAGVVGTLAFFTATASYFFTPVFEKVKAGNYGLGAAADLTFLLLVPVVYLAIYGAVWLIARLGGAWAWAKTLTAAIHGGVVGAAYGGDAAFALKGVSQFPPYVKELNEARIEAINLGGIDDDAIFVAARKLYASVLATDAIEGGLADPDTMWKHLSDALYHNAYMRDERVINTVCDHLRRFQGTGNPGSAR
ncbi:esterase/lipase family protein [Hyphomicrobium sulfonivorans]|uniref:esterase/lipase family protein n=1 Tax=Hyphomicrobium sulfonivorans TaxID=121290 RepID=UPI001FEA1189|nr:hypothetical protein [Hyphomicrobium sulfonivorans]